MTLLESAKQTRKIIKKERERIIRLAEINGMVNYCEYLYNLDEIITKLDEFITESERPTIQYEVKIMSGKEFDMKMQENGITYIDFACFCGISLATVYNIVASEDVKNVYIIALEHFITIKKED